MSPIIILVVFFSTLWGFVFFRQRALNMGVLISTVWAVAAWAGFLYYTSPRYETDAELYGICTYQPFFYLFILYLIVFLPIWAFRTDRLQRIELLPFSIIKLIVIVYAIASLCFVLFWLRPALDSLAMGVGANRDLVLEDLGGSVSAPLLIRAGIGIRSCFNLLSYFLLFYLLAFYRKHKFLIVLLAVCIYFPNFLVVLGVSSRSEIVFTLMNSIAGFVFFRKFIPQNLQRKILLSCFVIGGGFIGILVCITLIRFSGGRYDGLFGVFPYAGESFINFNILAYDKVVNFTGGPNLFPHLSLLWGIDLEYFRYLPVVDQTIFLLEYSQLNVNAAVFYTVFGDLYIAYGPCLSIVVLTSISFLLFVYLHKSENGSLAKIIIFQLYFGFFYSGVFYCPIRSFAGERMIVCMLMLSLFFALRQQGKKMLWSDEVKEL